MINSIRSVRKAKGLTLEDVALRCDPPTTPQTIGRLETGTRTLSIDWLNRIADALEVSPADLVRMPEEEEHFITALLTPDGARAPTKPEQLPPAPSNADMVTMRVTGSTGDYRAGDEIWCTQVDLDDLARALNRDVLVPRPAGRFLFGRLIFIDGEMLHILPPGSGHRQQVVTNPQWLAVANRLVRNL